MTCVLTGDDGTPCGKPARHTFEFFPLSLHVCCDHAQARIEALTKQVTNLAAALERRGLTAYGVDIAARGGGL